MNKNSGGDTLQHYCVYFDHEIAGATILFTLRKLYCATKGMIVPLQNTECSRPDCVITDAVLILSYAAPLDSYHGLDSSSVCDIR